jgi:chromosomal replication initiator protein
VRLSEDVLLLIADRVRTNIRDLEGCLVRLMAVAALTGQEISLELAEEVLQHYVHPDSDQLTPERIVALVSEQFSVKVEALFGQRRTRSVALPRQVAMYLLRQLTELSLVDIGRVFGGRDHSTVIYACEKVGTMVATDNEFAERINGFISTLAAG